MELEGNPPQADHLCRLPAVRHWRIGGRAQHAAPLIVIWDNSPAHRGDAIRAYLTTPNLNLRLVNLPSYSPDFNADEAIWGWVRQEATANQCLGTRATVREKVGGFFTELTQRRDEVKRRCRTVLQGKSRQIDWRHPSRPSPPRKCRSHLRFSLVLKQDDPQGTLQCVPFQRMAVVPGHSLPAAQELGHAVVGAHAGAHRRDFQCQFVDVPGPRPHDGLHLSGGFHLEHAHGVAPSQVVEDA